MVIVNVSIRTENKFQKKDNTPSLYVQRECDKRTFQHALVPAGEKENEIDKATLICDYLLPIYLADSRISYIIQAKNTEYVDILFDQK